MDTMTKGILVIVLLIFVAVFTIAWAYKVWQKWKEDQRKVTELIEGKDNADTPKPN